MNEVNSLESCAVDGTDAYCCLWCGTLLPKTSQSDTVSCPGCSFSYFVRERKNTKETFVVKMGYKEDDGMKSSGLSADLPRPTIDEVCQKCGHTKMYYRTAQLRSADEGETVFYECTKCGHRHSSNS